MKLKILHQNCGVSLYQYQKEIYSLNAHFENEKRLKSIGCVQLRKLTNYRVNPKKNQKEKNHKEEIIMENRSSQKRTSSSSAHHLPIYLHLHPYTLSALFLWINCLCSHLWPILPLIYQLLPPLLNQIVPFSCIINFPLSTGQFPSGVTHSHFAHLKNQATNICLFVDGISIS